MYQLLKSTKTKTVNNPEKCNEKDMDKLVNEANGMKFTHPDVTYKNINLIRLRNKRKI